MQPDDPFALIDKRLRSIEDEVRHLSTQLDDLSQSQSRRSLFFERQGNDIHTATKACLFLLVAVPLTSLILSWFF